MAKWIKADTLPPLQQDWNIYTLYESEDVLVYDGWSLYVAFYRVYTDDPDAEDSGWRTGADYGDGVIYPTHWRKLPKPPAL